MRSSGAQRAVIGVSGGLDSTLALLVAVAAGERLGWPRDAILAYTMPGFATGSESLARAHRLMAALGVAQHELDIRPTASAMLETIKHPYAAGVPLYDITFENVQAGLRTDFLFRIANQSKGLVIGTGDLSELALGWCTYGVGDHMSHYNPNVGTPKTLIQHLIRWFIRQRTFGTEVTEALQLVVTSDITPELIPVTDKGAQSTEATIGPYALIDFFLYYVLRYGFRPQKIAFLAHHAWGDLSVGTWPNDFPENQKRAYTAEEIKKWLLVFIERYFGLSQFKRSALPNGPKVSPAGSLSPRGDWRAPSDATAEAWIRDLEKAFDQG